MKRTLPAQRLAAFQAVGIALLVSACIEQEPAATTEAAGGWDEWRTHERAGAVIREHLAL